MTALPELFLLFGLLALLQAKHLVADFLLQTQSMLAEKGQYGAPGGIAHAGLHGVLSLAALLICGLPVAFSMLLVLAEFVVHYHIDWTKDRLAHRMQTGPQDRAFWGMIGVDQFAHQLTYVVMVWLVALQLS